MHHGAMAILVLLAMATAASGSGTVGEGALPDSRLGVRTAPLLLLSRTDVRADLGLDAAQTADALAALRTLYERARGLKGMKGEAAIAARRAIDEEQQRWFESRLTDVQRGRLVQIDLQWEGPSALVSRRAVGDAIGLSPAQRETIVQVVATHAHRPSRDTFQPGEERALAQKVLATLTESQRAQWLAMLGRPFRPQVAAAPPTRPLRR